MNNFSAFDDDLEQALATLIDGGIILYPTDTIWGLGCDATNDQAVKRIFDIKKRPSHNPFIILVHSEAMLLKYVEEVPEIAFELIENAKQPLTLIFPKAKKISPLVCGQDNSIAIRVVNEPFCKALISTLKKPIVSTSANISGEPNPAIFSEIHQTIKQSVDYIVKYRQQDTTCHQPSSIIKILSNNKIEKIR
ncbi:MAG: threonylcarbamoyl-AMP synthase [Bacteroidales bacterium]|jgi:L-threonylcarbamoyladenylate synthase|nr:threonylcarbamoyl-AMP synthase [Bacteroidales bacterium]